MNLDTMLSSSRSIKSRRSGRFLGAYSVIFRRSMYSKLTGGAYYFFSNKDYKSFSNFSWMLEQSSHLHLLNDEFFVGKGIILDTSLKTHFIVLEKPNIPKENLNVIQRRRAYEILISIELLTHPKLSKFFSNGFFKKIDFKVMQLETLNDYLNIHEIPDNLKLGIIEKDEQE